MTDNKLFLWTLILAAAYWLFALIDGSYHSTFASSVLLVFGVVTLIRYLPETWHVVINRRRNPSDPGDGSHLSLYGVSLLSAGSVYVGLFGVLWVWNGQPASWLATPISGFGRYMMGAGFALLYFSPDIEAHRLKVPGRFWFMILGALALIMAFYLGMRVGAKDETAAFHSARICPLEMPIKGHRSGVYHVPGGPYYQRTNPDACFRSTNVASAFGLRRVQGTK